jgi:hypothetical protein
MLKHSPPDRLILVTGPPRGGTTVVGEMLGLAPRTATLHEPMNADTGDRAIHHMFEVPGTDGLSEDDFGLLVERVLQRNMNLRSGSFAGEPLWRRMAKSVTGGRTVLSQRRARLAGRIETLIWKDPFAVFAVDAITRHVPGCTTIFCYRPPLAMAASFKRMRWRADPRPIIRRLRMAGVAAELPEGQDLSNCAISAAILWRLVYGSLLERMASFDGRADTFLLDIDDAIRAPVDAYGALFAQCRLDFTPRVQASISARYRTREGSDRPIRQVAHDRSRDPASVNSYWTEILDADEVRIVRALCEPLQCALADRFPRKIGG